MRIVRPFRMLNEAGFDHLIGSVLVVVVFGIIGSAYLVYAHAANSKYYDGTCTKTTDSVGSHGACVEQAQDLLDALQHQQVAEGHSYRTATGPGAGVFRYGNVYYLIMNGSYNNATSTAVYRLYGNGSLTGGTASNDGWQILCSAAAQYGLAANRGAGANKLVFSRAAGEYTTSPTYIIFNDACGFKLTRSSSPSSGGGSSSNSGGSPSSTTATTTTTSSSGAPTTRLGIWLNAENSSPGFVTTPGQHPDVANYYQAWGHSWPTTFVDQALAQGATPFIELEPWEMGGNWSKSPSTTPSFSDIDAGKYDAWLKSVGNDAKATGKPIIFTFAHEFNIGYQYPWSIVPPSSTGSSCGSNPCTPAQWIKAWDHVESVVDSTAGGHAYWMWAPNVDNSGSGTPYDPVPYWPGASEVQMVGVDGYPSFINPSGGTFQSDFGMVFSEIHQVTKLPIFISETNLSYLGKGGFESIPNYIHDLCADGGDGVLEYEDGLPALSSTQWSQLDTALAKCSN